MSFQRSGIEVGLASRHDALRKVAQETLDIVKNGQYTAPNGETIDIASSVAESIRGAVYHKHDEVFCTSDVYNIATIEVVNETTTQAAIRMMSEGKDNIVALNFANALTPGGNWLHGAKAQEEDLARCSSLYSSLRLKTSYYNTNLLLDDLYYSHGIIYSPKVPFFRSDDLVLLSEPYLLSIITSPAPNVSMMSEVDNNKLMDTLYVRMVRILEVAARYGHKNIILGAWGCGSFGNDAVMVATLFAKALKAVPLFRNVCFAVYDNKPEQYLYNTFKEIVK